MSIYFNHYSLKNKVFPEDIPVKAFSACTMEEINKICSSGLASDYVSQGTWTIGDINNNASYGSYSGVQLMHVLTEEQRNIYNTTGYIVVQFKSTIATSTWNSSYYSQTSYSTSTLLSTLNSTIYNGLNSDFKSVLKQFGPPTSVQSSSSESSAITSVEYPMGYLHEPNCVEVGSSNEYRPSENSASFVLKYYENGGSRIKSGVGDTWWLRSPSATYPGYSRYLAYFVTGDGSLYYFTYVNNSNCLSPIAVI